MSIATNVIAALGLVAALSGVARADDEHVSLASPVTPAQFEGEGAETEGGTGDRGGIEWDIARDSVPRKWRFELTPYFFLAGMSGDIGANGRTAAVHMTACDILENLSFGAMGTAEIRFWRVGLLIDGMYIAMDGGSTSSKSGRAFSSDADVEQLTLGCTFFVRVIDHKRFLLDPYVGFRANYLEVDIDVDYVDADRPDESGNAAANWTDPVIGVRMTWPFPEGWSVIVSGDIGGFSVGSEFAWQCYGGLRWDMNKHVGLTFGYRAMGVDYEDDFVYDMITQGIQLGLVVGF